MAVKGSRHILALKRRKVRDAERKYLIEGIRLCEEALRSNAPIEQLIFCREMVDGNDRLRALRDGAQDAGIPIQETDRRALKGMCETETPQGVMGVVRMAEWDRERAMGAGSLLLLDRIRDPGNLGLILRTAEAAGTAALFLSPGSVELHNPKAVRASMGAIFRLPVFPGEALDLLVPQLQHRGTQTLCAAMSGTPYHQLSIPPPWALLLGNEAFGVDPKLASLADSAVAIPMAEGVESLNIAVAAGILLYQFSDLASG